jgi:HAD superfamily hydrolase (TIGR01509 family)
MFAVIFDFDGTILDSETPEYESHKRVFADHGVHLSSDDWCSGIGIVKPDTHWFDFLCARSATPPTFEWFREATRAYFRESVRMEPMPGISALIGALVATGVPCGIASTAPSGWVLRALDELHLAPTFDVIVTGDQVERSKPAPDVYFEAARRLNTAPERCVAIEDSGPGVAAATAAGMKTIAIPHALSRTHSFDGACLHVHSAADLTVDDLFRLFS